MTDINEKYCRTTEIEHVDDLEEMLIAPKLLRNIQKQMETVEVSWMLERNQSELEKSDRKCFGTVNLADHANTLPNDIKHT